MDNLNNIPNVGNWGDAASKLNDNFNKVKQAVTTVENTSKNNKGYFTSLSALNTAFPSPKSGQTAYVYDEVSSTNYYIYNAVNGAWVPSSVEAPSISIDISEYTKTGGSTKTTKDIEDDLVQLAGDVYVKPFFTSDSDLSKLIGVPIYGITMEGTASEVFDTINLSFFGTFNDVFYLYFNKNGGTGSLGLIATYTIPISNIEQGIQTVEVSETNSSGVSFLVDLDLLAASKIPRFATTDIRLNIDSLYSTVSNRDISALKMDISAINRRIGYPFFTDDSDYSALDGVPIYGITAEGAISETFNTINLVIFGTLDNVFYLYFSKNGGTGSPDLIATYTIPISNIEQGIQTVKASETNSSGVSFFVDLDLLAASKISRFGTTDIRLNIDSLYSTVSNRDISAINMDILTINNKIDYPFFTSDSDLSKLDGVPIYDIVIQGTLTGSFDTINLAFFGTFNDVFYLYFSKNGGTGSPDLIAIYTIPISNIEEGIQDITVPEHNSSGVQFMVRMDLLSASQITRFVTTDIRLDLNYLYKLGEYSYDTSLQNLINNNREVHLRASVYEINETLSIPSNTKITGVRGATIIRFAEGSSATSLISLAINTNNVMIDNVTFEGRTEIIPELCTYIDAKNQVGIGLDCGITSERSTYNIHLRNCEFKNFDMAGVRILRNLTQYSKTYKITDCVFENNYIGLLSDIRSEYHTFVGNTFAYNQIGAFVRGGNNFFGVCHFDGNAVGFLATGIITGENDSHGSVVGSTFNHNLSYDILCADIANGYTFSGCHCFQDGLITLDNCKGFLFSGGIISTGVEVINSNPSYNIIHSTIFTPSGTLSGNLAKLSLFGNRYLSGADSSSLNNSI